MEIQREKLMEAFQLFAYEGNGVVVGPPGVGKTVSLRKFCAQLNNQKATNFYFPVDKLPVESGADLKAELGIDQDFIDYLKAQRPSGEKNPAILLVDAFDAARSEGAQKFLLSLIRRVIVQLKGQWNIVVSVRTYDARKSEELQDLFPKNQQELVPSEYQIADIHCRHFAIPKLTTDEVIATAKTIPHLLDIYDRGSSELQELLRIPFNLWLFEKLLAIAPALPELGAVSSEIQLLGLFWKQRVTDGPLGEGRRVLLTKVSQAMVEQRSLSVRKEEVYASGSRETWNSLLSSEILIEVSTTAQRVSFWHNILFDYAVSVLLIEDDPQAAVEFITKDPSRPLFLRPSLSYYFTRTWYQEPKLFWKAFWFMLPSSDLHLRLFARLLPTTVIATETRKLEQLSPLLDGLAQNNRVAPEAILRLLQALRALDIEREALWVGFFDKLAENLRAEFAWDLAVLTSEILKTAEKSQNRSIWEACGRISRRLLAWVWEIRDGNKNHWAVTLGEQWAVVLVAKTFGSDPKQSRPLLDRVLELTKEDHFPIRFVSRLCEEIDHIWPYDPEFVIRTYLTVFGHIETSEETTAMGGIVLQLTSTRRQDFEMCQYLVIQHYPSFLKSSPMPASIAAIQSLNLYILTRHLIPYLKKGVSREDIQEKFQFRGKTVSYSADMSHIWDVSRHSDEPMKMAAQLYDHILQLAQSGKLAELDLMLDLFADNVLIAFFWRRLLEIGAKVPKVFAPRLFDLCVALPILKGSETLHEVGQFIEASASELSVDQLLQIEKSILSLFEDDQSTDHSDYTKQWRNRLLARIPSSLLQTTEGKHLREEMERENNIPSNEPLVHFGEFTSRAISGDDWLVEHGADISRPSNQRLREFFKSLDEFEQQQRNEIPSQVAIEAVLPIARNLYVAIQTTADADKVVLETAWTKLSACAKIISWAGKPDSEAFQFAREVLLKAALHESPQPDPQYESEYDSPHWSPAPRTEAAQGLPWLAAFKPDPEILTTIERLVHDQVGSVRYLATSELFRLSITAPEVFWKLAEDIADTEPKTVVQRALCHSLSYVISKEENKTVAVLAKLTAHIQATSKDGELPDDVIALIMGLVIAKENTWAVEIANSYLKEPVSSASLLHRAAIQALDFVEPNNLESSKRSIYFDRAISWIGKAIEASGKGMEQLLAIPQSEWNENTQAKMREVYGVIDFFINRTYYVVGLGDKIQENQQSLSDNQRRDLYFRIKPLLEQILALVSTKGKGVMFAPTAHRFMELLNGVIKYDPVGVLHMAAGVAQTSRFSNYNLDSLAIGETVKLVESILADYRSEVRADVPLEDLLNLLDIFAGAGWPEAIRLVWRLDEVFR